MKCKSCGSEWQTSAELKACPFCGKELIPEKKTADNATSMHEVLTLVVQEHGLEAMEKGKRMIAFYTDMAPEPLRKEKILLEYLVRCKGNELLLEVKDKPLPDRQVRYEQVVDKLRSESYVSKDAARKVCNAFCIAVYGESVEKKQAETPPKPEETTSTLVATLKAVEEKKKTFTPKVPPVDKAALDIRTTLYLTKEEADAGCLKQIHLPDGLASLTVKVPAGTADGATLRLKECGKKDPNAQWGMPCVKGDVYLTVSLLASKPQKPKKQPSTLYINLALTPEEALKGCQKKVTYAGVDNVTVNIPPNTPEGFVINLPHCGNKDPETGEKGPLSITITFKKSASPRSNQTKTANTAKEADRAIIPTNYVFYITPEQAQKGDSFMVKGVYGMRVTIPAGVKNGQVVTVKGHGKIFAAKVNISDWHYNRQTGTLIWPVLSDKVLEEHINKKPMSSGKTTLLCFFLFFLGFIGWAIIFYISRKNKQLQENVTQASAIDAQRRQAAKAAFAINEKK